MFDTWFQDVRYSFRLLRKSPMFTATAALSLAIGIGANTTIFSIASALLLRPLPGLADTGRLVDIGRTQNGDGFDTVSYPNYRDLRERTRTLEGVYAYRIEPEPMSLGGLNEALRIYGMAVSANFFSLLGTQPAAGRLLHDADDAAPPGKPVIVISHDLWQRHFNADPALVGRTITINSRPFAVVGVAPRGFQGTTILKPDAWVPMSALAESTPRMSADIRKNRQAVWLMMGGRLRPGVSQGQANAEVAAIGAALEREYPRENEGKGFTVKPLSIFPGRTSVIVGFVGVLMVIVCLVLLIACINVSGVMLARAAARRREIAVRVALGAGRSRLIRQILVETAALFAVGGAAGLLLSRWLTSLLLSVIPSLPLPISVSFATDWRVISFAAAVSALAALLSGLVPALHASTSDLVPALKSEGLEGGGSRLRIRSVLVVGQITLSLMLAITAGLLLRSLQHAANVDPGFDSRNVDVVSLDLSLAGYNQATSRPFVTDLMARVGNLPGVTAVTMGMDLPLDGGRMGMGGLTIPGVEPPRGLNSFPIDWNVVEPGWFDTLKLPLVKGRDFSESDTAASQGVAILNEAAAARFWPGQDPMGRQVGVADGPAAPIRTLTIVGIAKDARLMSLGEVAEPYIYVPVAQQFATRIALLVRTSDGHSTVPQVREIVRSLNPNLPITEAMPLSQVTAIGLVPQRMAAAVAASLGIVGLLLAAIGIYGVTSYAVSRRTREIGIRVALGADRARVLRLVLRQGLMLAAIGVIIGAGLAAAGSRLLGSLLFGVPGLDPVTFASACALFAAVTLVATYIPARRATSVDPMVALRDS